MKTFVLTTFKPSGKYYEEGEFTTPDEMCMFEITRHWILDNSGGKCPGLSGSGAEFHWAIYPKGDHDFPKLLMASDEFSRRA